MKISLKKTSPNYRQKLSTQKIMFDLTIALAVLAVVAVGYNFTRGSEYGIHALLIFVISIVTALVTEFVYAFVTKKANVRKAIENSFPLVTALIFAMTLPVGTPYYVVAIGSFIAIFFGKLVYGGFGQNIFNPALVGRVIVHLSFGAQLTANLGGSDAVTAATPLTAWASTNFLGEVNTNLGTLFTGMYPGALGETFTLVILALGVFLTIRHVIDYRITVSYLLTAIILGAIQGAMGGVNPLVAAVTHLCMGGLAFGAVFMATDPVTSPTDPFGKIIYGIGLGFITMLIRIKANYPEGTMFAILMMNMLTPMIDGLSLCRTNKNMKKKYASLGVVGLVAMLTIGGISSTLELPEVKEPEPETPKAEYSLVSQSGNTYVVTSSGFGGDVEVEVDFDGMDIVSVKVVSYNGETEGFGKDLIEVGNGGSLNENAQVFHDTILAGAFNQETLEGIDTSTGATYTTQAIVKAIKGAIEEKAKNPVISADGNVYVVSGKGFGGEANKIQLEVTLDKANRQVLSVTVISYNGETEGFGKDLIEVGNGGSLVEAAQAFHDTIFGGAFSYDTLTGIDTTTGATFTAKGIVEAIQAAIDAYDAILDKSPDGVYTINTKGFGDMSVEVSVNGDTVSVTVLSYDGETPGFGKDLIEGTNLTEVAQAFHDTILGGSFTTDQISGIDTSTGSTMTAKGIMDAINKAVAADQQ